MNFKSHITLLTLLGSFCAAQAHSESTTTFDQIISESSLSADFRYRYEFIDQESKPENARASTLRSRLRFNTGEYDGFSALIEGANVLAIGSERYNSTANGLVEYPVVADPEGSVLNQVYVNYARENSFIRVGRQIITHGDQRFVGAVGWRQNDQVFDATRVVYKPMDNLKIDYAFVNRVHRIFGPDDGANPAELEGNNHLLNINTQLSDEFILNAYLYDLDFSSQANYIPAKVENLSSRTVGVDAQYGFGQLTARVRYAQQRSAGASRLDYRTHYYAAGLKYKIDTLEVGASYEVFGSDNGVGFATPLATNAIHNGWALAFPVTPGVGLIDANMTASYRTNWGILLMGYHDFSSEVGHDSFGSEVDLGVIFPIKKSWDLSVKVADFQSSSSMPDTQILWLTTNIRL